MINSVVKFRILLYLFVTAFCWQVYSVDFPIYYRFNLDDNICNCDFMHLDPEDDIDLLEIPQWVSISGCSQWRTFTATETNNFAQYPDYQIGGVFVRDYLLATETFEIIFQWDQVDNINIITGKTYKASILRNYVRHGDPVFLYDEDIYCFTPSQGAYCLEFDENSNVKLAISYDGNTYTEYEIKDTVKTFQSTTLKYKRAYKIDWEKHHKYYIKILGDYSSANYFNSSHNYSFAIKEVKPVILVHGINSHPIDNGMDNDTAFGELREKLSLVPEIKPTWVFDFPWDAGNGLYTRYCGSDSSNGTIHKYLEDKCEPFDEKPIIMAHSMGGMLVLKQTKIDGSFISKVDDIIFFATPFCGSDDADNLGAGLLASSENIKRLQRGTQYTWDLMENVTGSFANHKKLFFYGIYDWVVDVCSSDLPNILDISGESHKCKKGHIMIKRFTFPCDDEHEKMFNKIIPRIND